jgi:hypothetical protein
VVAVRPAIFGVPLFQVGVHVAQGVAGAEHDLGQLMLPASQTGNVKFGHYPAGHIVYLNVAEPIGVNVAT